MICLTYGAGIGMMCLIKSFVGTAKGSGILLGYISPTIIAAAIFLLCFFEKLTIKSIVVKKFIRMMSGAILGVYLIHDNLLIWKNIITDFSKRFIDANIFIMVFKVIGSVLVIFFAAAGIELLRKNYFNY